MKATFICVRSKYQAQDEDTGATNMNIYGFN